MTDFSQALAAWLEPLSKKQEPEQFRAVRAALDSEGRNFVDHEGQMNSSPGTMEHSMRRYREQVLHAHGTVRPVRSSNLRGVTRKIVYQSTPAPLLGDQDTAHYMVKPYHERVSRRLKGWMHFPIQGWAEMANQGLYHAAGIGHLHQRVHVDEHDMGEGHEREPALVVHMSPGFDTAANAYGGGNVLAEAVAKNPGMVEDARRIGLMDFLGNNLDRHGGNLIVHPDGKLLAIDHSRNFQYKAKEKWDTPGRVRYGKLEDSLKSYINSPPLHALRYAAGFQDGGTFHWNNREHPDFKPLWHDSELWGPAFDWWGSVSNKVRERMAHELKHIKSDKVRAHIARNFNARANLLDEMAETGPGAFGHWDWHDTKVPMYRPDEKAEGEE